MTKRRRTRPGDVYELVVDAGFAYLQAIAKHKDFGWAMRVLSPVPRSVGDDARRAVLDAPELFVSLMGNVALEAAEGRLRFVGSAQLPDNCDGSLPIFRASAAIREDGRHEDGSWWLDDGTKEWHVGTLTEGQKKFPYRRLVPALALRVLIDAGWDPNWEFAGPAAQEYQKSPRWNVGLQGVSSFHLFFSRADDARGAAEVVSEDRRVVRVSVLEPSHDESPLYGVVAEAGYVTSDDVAEFDEYFEAIAKRFGGKYDGNELPISTGTGLFKGRSM
ncbi:MAG TPA: hypothetical protein VGC72_04740 [Candidatus Elarobacter sp.]